MVYNQDAPSGWVGNILGGATMWISNGLSQEAEDAAMAFLLFFSNTENSASWHTASGYVPVRNSSIELLKNLEPGNEILWDIPSGSRVDIEADDWYAAFPNFLTASTQLGQFYRQQRDPRLDLWHIPAEPSLLQRLGGRVHAQWRRPGRHDCRDQRHLD